MIDAISCETSNYVLTITLSRPEKKNSLTAAMYDRLSDIFEAAENDPEVRVILLRAEGDYFTAGNDLHDFMELSAGGGSEEPAAFRLIRILGREAKPIVSAVQGNAVGVGATLLLHCDLVYIAENASLIAPFVNLALVPEAASTLLLPQRIGHVRAYAMFALGEPMDAESAVNFGLVNEVLPVDKVCDRAAAAAAMLAKKSVEALAATKRLMRDQFAVAEQIEQERALFLEQLKSADAIAAFEAFAARSSKEA